MDRPRILIPLPNHSDIVPSKYGINQSYIHAVTKNGGEPLCVIRPDAENMLGLLPLVSGILVVGGNDIDPEFYGQKNDGFARYVDRERDQTELTLVRLALKYQLPLLGICRGMQVINVALGGSLYQDVHEEMSGALVHDHHAHGDTQLPRGCYLAHSVDVVEGTLLYRLVKEKTIKGNSLHHQGVKTLGKSLTASAIAPDGLVEAIEISDHPFGLGVEWHPEELIDAASQNIFTSFINAAKNAAAKRSIGHNLKKVQEKTT